MSPFGPPWIQLSAMYLEEEQRRRAEEKNREGKMSREDEQRGRAGKRSGEEEYVRKDKIEWVWEYLPLSMLSVGRGVYRIYTE